MTRKPYLVAIGEPLIEFTRTAQQTWHMGYGGDALNTAMYAKWLGADSELVTMFGEDPFGRELMKVIRGERIEIGGSASTAGRTGIYFVHTDKRGERSFTYCRAGSVASLALHSTPRVRLAEMVRRSETLYITGISLAVMTDHWRLFEALESRSPSLVVAFDPNYRAALWQSSKAFIASVKRMMRHVQVILPSVEDLAALHPAESIAQVIERYAAKNITCVVKCGRDGVRFFDGNLFHRVRAPRVPVVDTTGAGDAFNAAFLVARASGASMLEAVQRGVQVASIVVQHPGAIVDHETFDAGISDC